MAPAFRSGSATAYGASHTNITITPPAGIANGDILVAMIVTGALSPPIPSGPTGWTAFGTDIQDGVSGSFFVNLRTFWKRASSESGSYTFNHATASSAGWIGCYSGCITSGTPLNATSTNTGSNNLTSTGLSITTTAANSMLLWLSNDFADNANNLTPPTGMTERLDAVVLYTADQLIASAGATGNRTMTNNNSLGVSTWGVRMVELLAATAGGAATGTLSTTLGAATLAATGTIPARGTASNTLGAATLSAAGTVANQVFSGSFNQTLGALTGTLTGKVTVGGTAAATLLPLTLVGTGTVASQVSFGTLATTLASLTLAATGTAVNRVSSGTLSATLGSLVLAARGRTAISVSPPRRVWLVGRLDTEVALTARAVTQVALVGRLVTNVPLDALPEVSYGRNVQYVRRRYQVVASERVERARRAG